MHANSCFILLLLAKTVSDLKYVFNIIIDGYKKENTRRDHRLIIKTKDILIINC